MLHMTPATLLPGYLQPVIPLSAAAAPDKSAPGLHLSVTTGEADDLRLVQVRSTRGVRQEPHVRSMVKNAPPPPACSASSLSSKTALASRRVTQRRNLSWPR